MQLATITFASLLLPLCLLACPLMMMWMMRPRRQRHADPASPQPPSAEVLREEQRRISRQIEQLEAGESGAGRPAVGP